MTLPRMLLQPVFLALLIVALLLLFACAAIDWIANLGENNERA